MATIGFEYRKIDSGIVIEKYLSADSIIDVPPKINGLPVVEISAEAFVGCMGLKKIFLPDSLKSIDEQTFFGCASLTEIHWRDMLIKIGNEDFKIRAGTPNEIYLPRVPIHFGNASDDKKISPPDKLDDAQKNSLPPDDDSPTTNDEKIPPTPVDQFEIRKTDWGTVIEKYVGEDSVVVIPNEIAALPVKRIDVSAFNGCKDLTEIHFPDGLQSIAEWAFAFCKGLTEIHFPKNLHTIGWAAFNSCANLKKIRFPNALESIGDGAFYRCTALAEIHFPRSLKSIGEKAFAGCTGLTEIYFPCNLESIGERIFAGCTDLTEIHLPAALKTLDERAFSGCTGLKNIYVPKNIYDHIKNRLRRSLPEDCQIHYV